MILVGIGANLPSPRFGSPLATCEAAVAAMAQHGIGIAAQSRWFRSAPVPMSDQPWYVNGIVRVETSLDPVALLGVLNRIEADFGRVRGERNAPRVLDLDLIAYDDLVTDGRQTPVLPHPRMHERAFVLLPLADVAPEWRHPVSGRSVSWLLSEVSAEQITEPVESTGS